MSLLVPIWCSGRKQSVSDLYGGSKSAIRSLSADANSFDARDALYSIQYYGTIPSAVSDDDGMKFIQGMKAALEQNQSNTTFKEYGALLT